MDTLPLFPLNTVLFPGIPLHLHIFEDRYKQMVRDCLNNEMPFGVVLIKKGREALGPLAQPYMVGCTSQILQSEPLDDGRLNISSVGGSRFRIHSLDNSRAYLFGDVEYYTLDGQENPMLEPPANRIRAWVQRYLDVLGRAGEVKFDASKIPEDPIMMGHLAAYILQAPAAEKQKLLELDHAGEFLDQLEQLYRRETSLLRALLEQEERLGSNSLN